MSKRKAISWKTKYAAALLALRHIPYDDAKQMTEDQLISLYNLDHFPYLYSSEHPDRDMYWNLVPVLILPHREKTKKDAKIIAKSRRIRKKLDKTTEEMNRALTDAMFLGTGSLVVRHIPSRGFDKAKTRGFDGKVRERRR